MENAWHRNDILIRYEGERSEETQSQIDLDSLFCKSSTSKTPREFQFVESYELCARRQQETLSRAFQCYHDKVCGTGTRSKLAKTANAVTMKRSRAAAVCGPGVSVTADLW